MSKNDESGAIIWWSRAPGLLLGSNPANIVLVKCTNVFAYTIKQRQINIYLFFFSFFPCKGGFLMI